jgi:hypothetical protein
VKAGNGGNGLAKLGGIGGDGNITNTLALGSIFRAFFSSFSFNLKPKIDKKMNHTF